jgi:hypothetical protein
MVLLAKFQRVIYSLAGWLTAKPCLCGVEIALSETSNIFSTIHVFSNWKILLLHYYLLYWLTAGFIPLPFQPVGVCVEYRIILQLDIFAPLQSAGARQPVLALSEAISPFSLYGS